MERKRASRVLSSGAGKHTDCVELVPIGRSEICLTAGEGLAADGVVAVFQDYGIVTRHQEVGDPWAGVYQCGG